MIYTGNVFVGRLNLAEQPPLAVVACLHHWW